MPKNPFRSKKGASASSSSKQPKASKKQKKRRMENESSDAESEEYMQEIEEEEEMANRNFTNYIPRKVVWGAGPLSRQDLNHQVQLFRRKYADDRVIRDNLCCERTIAKSDFHGMGLITKFATLGWEAVLDFNDGGDEEIYFDEILNWMGTLVKEDGRNPPRTTRLIGTVKGQKVIMSFHALRQIAAFDSKPEGDYQYIRENDYWHHPEHIGEFNQMLAALFDPSKGAEMKRDNLKPRERLMLSLMLTNITPRLGDKQAIRMHEVVALYAIITGDILLSFRQLAMMHVWQAREARGKKLIPHCRLINALLKRAGVVRSDDRIMKKPQQHFKLTELRHEGWRYKSTRKWHKLKIGNDKFRMLQFGQEPPREGEVDDLDSSGDDGARAGGANQPGPGEAGYSWGVFDSEMEASVQSARPPKYGDWPSMNRALYDQSTRHNATTSRELRELREHQNRLAAIQMFNHEHEVNMRYFDNQQERMFHDWEAGRPVVQYPPHVDYTQLAPYDGSIRHPSPQPHHSMWVDPAYSWQYYQSSQDYPHQPQSQQSQQQQHGSGGEGSSGAMDFASSWLSQMGDWFSGGPGPAYH